MEKVFGYVAPQVEVIEVEVEKGFANSSGGTGGTGSDLPGDDF